MMGASCTVNMSHSPGPSRSEGRAHRPAYEVKEPRRRGRCAFVGERRCSHGRQSSLYLLHDSSHPEQYSLHFLDEFSVGDKLLGAGHSGRVVKGWHKATNKSVAIKIVDPLHRPNAERARKLFEREVDLHAVVSGLPHVVRLLRASPPTSKARCYLATELVTSGDLFQHLRKRKALPENVVRNVVIQLLVAVNGLHQHNICHRDIKPENILLKRSESNPREAILKLADFGHAGQMPANAALLHTRDCGTPGYKAPELRAGWKHGHGLPADLWSVGAVMNDCFSFKSRQHQVDDESFWKREVYSALSMNARNLLGRLLTADPSERITAEAALRHPWTAGSLSSQVDRGVSSPDTMPVDDSNKALHRLGETNIARNTISNSNIRKDEDEGDGEEEMTPKHERNFGLRKTGAHFSFCTGNVPPLRDRSRIVPSFEGQPGGFGARTGSVVLKEAVGVGVGLARRVEASIPASIAANHNDAERNSEVKATAEANAGAGRLKERLAQKAASEKALTPQG